MISTIQRKQRLMNRLILPIALVIVVGLVQIALAIYSLNAGSIKHWGVTIIVVGMLFNIAVIVYSVKGKANRTNI